jgi:hypothetical protein
MSDTTSTKRRRAFATGLCAAVALPVHAAAPQTAHHRRFIDEAFARSRRGWQSPFVR